MAEDLVAIGISYDTSQLTAGARQVQTAMQQLTQAEKQTHTASEQLASSSTKTAQAFRQEGQAATQAASATQHVAQSASQAASSLTRTASAATQAAQATGEMGQQARGASGFLQTLLNQALAFGGAQVGIQAVSQALGLLKDAAVGAVQAAVKMESLTATFTAISGSAQAGAKDLAFLRGTAERLGVSFTGLAQGYTNLTAAAQGTSLAGEKTQAIFTAVAEKGRVLGKSADEINGALLAVAQSFSKNTIAAEELRGQFAERMPGAMQEMARAAGVSTQALDKMMQTGGLGIEMWYRWSQTVKSDLGVATEEAAKTAGAALARLGNDFQKFGEALGQYLLPPLKDAVDWLHRVATEALTVLERLRQTAEARKGLEEVAKAQPRAIAGQSEELGPLNKQIATIEARRAAVMGGMRDPLAFANEEEYQRLLARRNVLLEQQTKALQDQKKLRDDMLAAEADQPIVIPGAETQLKVRDALKDINTEVEKINRQRAAGLPLEDALTAKIKVYSAALETARKTLAEQPGTFAMIQKSVQPAINAAQQQLALLEKQKDAITGAEAAERKAAQAREKAAREAEQQQKKDVAASLKQDEPFLQQVADAADLLGEMQRRTERLKMTEEERFRVRVEAMATERPYLREQLEAGLKALEIEEKRLDNLKERNKRLQDEAAVSAARLTNLDRLQAQLEPRRRGETTEQRLTRTYTELSNAPGVTMGRLSQASEQIRETLDTERWQEWSDFATQSIDKVGDAITQFAFHGKLTFKDMVDSIAEDFFRMSLRMLTESAFSSAGGGGKGGGWLDLALKAGTSLLSAFSGTPTSGTLPTSWGAYGTMSAAGAFSGRQGGGTALAGVPYWVGEAGPELVVPKQTSTVITHQQSMAMPAPTVNVYIQGVTNPNEWRPSQGAVQRTVASAVSQAYRGL